MPREHADCKISKTNTSGSILRRYSANEAVPVPLLKAGQILHSVDDNSTSGQIHSYKFTGPTELEGLLFLHELSMASSKA